ncbi:MAG: phage portal protein, partial [Rhizobium sp.]
LWYKTEAGGQKRKVPADDILHFKGLSWDGIEGIDVLTYMANAFALGPAARKWMSKLLSRGSTAGGLLQLPRELSPEARKKRQEEFDKYQSGLDNAFRTLALEDGAKWIRTMITPQEAMIFQVLGFDAKSVSNVFGVPAHKLGDDTRNSYNSLEQENKSYLEDSLDPWCCEVETECNDKLLTEDEKTNQTRAIKIDRSEFEVGDRAAETTAATTAVNGGLISPDEGRARLNYPPMPNGEGKKIRIPVNVAIDGQIAGRIAGVTPEPPGGAAPPPAPAPAGQPKNLAMQNAARELVLDRLKRLDKIAADQLPKATNKGSEAVADFWRNHRERIRDALVPALPIVALANGISESLHSADEIAAVLQGTVDEQLGEVLRLVTTAKE